MIPPFLIFRRIAYQKKHCCWESMAGMTTNILI